MAHPSGLYAYLSSNAEIESSHIQCIGPFSSYKDRLVKRDVARYVADAVEQIESLPEFEGKFTYWGSLSRKSTFLPTVSVMGHEYGLIPNPCFRSEILISTKRASDDPTLLVREWTPSHDYTQIHHKPGSHFSFPVNRRRRYSIGGQIDTVAADLRTLEPAIVSITLRSLGGLALAVLSELGGDLQKPRLKKLTLRCPDSIAV